MLESYIMVAMTHDELKALVAGYAMGILDSQEKQALEEHLPTCSTCPADLATFQEVTDELALSLEPLPLPQGHLKRFRLKVELLEPTAGPSKIGPIPASAPIHRVIEAGALAQARQKRQSIWGQFNPLAYAAALVLLVIAGILGYFLYDTSQQVNDQKKITQALLSDQQKLNQTFANLLAAPDLKVTDLHANGDDQKVTARVLATPQNKQALLVSENLQALPNDKNYQVWFISADGKAQSGAVFAYGNRDQPALINLSPPGDVSQYKIVAMTVEQRGGSTTGPTSTPFVLGNLS